MNWNIIDTAPKNEAGEFIGPTILIFNQADLLPWPAYWGPSEGCLVEGAWIIADDAASVRLFNTPDVTHWMPLPTPPEAP